MQYYDNACFVAKNKMYVQEMVWDVLNVIGFMQLFLNQFRFDVPQFYAAKVTLFCKAGCFGKFYGLALLSWLSLLRLLSKGVGLFVEHSGMVSS